MEPNSNRIEKYLEETMLEYLRSQIEIPEFDVDSRDSIDDGDFVIEFEVNRVLDKLVENVQRTASLKVKYEETGKTHHQAVLFKLPGFPLDVNLMRKLCFRECLIVSNVDEALGSKECTPDPAGALCLHIQLARDSIPPNIPPQNEDVEYNIAPSIKNEVNPQREADDHASYKLVVHLSSEFEIEGKNAGSRIVSWVDRNLHTLEERRTEYIRESPNVINKQTLYVALQRNKYYLRHQSTLENVMTKKKYYPLGKTKDFVGEGANFILMRYLAITKFEGMFELSTMYINGDMCRNIYECEGAKMSSINGNPVEVTKIYRVVIEECGIHHISATVLTVYGLIVSHEWDGSPYILHINPLSTTSGKPTKHDCLSLKKTWETDFELMSKYLDCKTEAELKMNTYLKDHPEVRTMMEDYTQNVLLLKPSNVLSFTYDYFTNLGLYRLPNLPYFEDDYDEDDEMKFFW